MLSALFVIISSKVDIADVFAKLLSTNEEISVRAISEAVADYRWDNDGTLPPDSNITAELKFICKETVSLEDCTAAGGVSLHVLLQNQTYLTELPVHWDYEAATELMTGYRIQYPVGEGERVRVTSPTESEEFVH